MDMNELIEQLQTERHRIDAVIKLLSGSDTTTSAKVPKATRKRKKISAEARERIGDAQRKRWAKQKSPEKDFYAQRVVATAHPPHIPRPGSFFDMVRAQAAKPTTLARIIAYCVANGKFTTAKSTTFVATVRVRHALTRLGYLQRVGN
jgi:hypothetical protein